MDNYYRHAEKKIEYSHRLQHVVLATHFEKDDLRHDGAEFPARGSDPMPGRAVARGE